jgi:anti-sigma regulatory factor (Ser/Thr protein kinase)
LRCPYDVGELSAPIARAARDSHPVLVEVGSYRGSTGYGGLHHVESIFRSELAPAPDGCTLIHFGGSDLVAVRAEVARAAREAGLGSARGRSLTTAVAEIAADAERPGRGGGELRIWARPDALVCQITDRGRRDDPLVGRRVPATDEVDDRGLWLANQVSDLVQVRSTPDGSTVRVFAWL